MYVIEEEKLVKLNNVVYGEIDGLNIYCLYELTV